MTPFRIPSRPGAVSRGAKQMMGNTLKRFPTELAWLASSVLGPRSRQSAILTYHRVWPPDPRRERPSMNVSPGHFRLQLEGLLDSGYRFLALRDLCQLAYEGRIPERSLVVTFDDVFESVYHGAFPVLRELQIPATLFLATAFLGSREPFPFDSWGRRHQGTVPPEGYRPISALQCREMMSSGIIEIGAHTHTHRRLAGHIALFERDLDTCFAQLRSEFGLERIPFAFPFGRRALGAVTDGAMEVARQLGAYCALTTDCAPIAPDASPFGWGRFNVDDSDTARSIRAKISGWFHWSYRVQDLASFLYSATHVTSGCH